MNGIGFILAIESWLLRKGMVTILNRFPDTRVIREFDNAPALLDYFRNHEADYLVVSQAIFDQVTDLFLSRTSLLDRTILLTDRIDGEASGKFQATIHTGAKKEVIMARIMEVLESRLGLSSQPKPFELTPREQTIVKLVSMGLTNKKIAEQLFLSTHTVITHRKNITAKLGIKSVSGLTVYAIVNNIITIEEVTSKPGT